jgi:hypothetical protein
LARRSAVALDGTAGRTQIGVRCYPISDEGFVADVHAAVDGWPDGQLDARSLEHLLTTRYPAVRVVPQDPLAAFGSRFVLYIYRDGHP